MINTNKIFSTQSYQDILRELEDLEKDRIYCKHNLEHFMDVCRIAYILNLEEALGLSKDLVYTTGLLHDIGRVDQYKTGVDHALRSYELAKAYLELTDFSQEEKDLILGAIKNHRKNLRDNSYESLFYRADKLSRACHSCPAKDKCNWSDEKKNLHIKY